MNSNDITKAILDGFIPAICNSDINTSVKSIRLGNNMYDSFVEEVETFPGVFNNLWYAPNKEINGVYVCEIDLTQKHQDINIYPSEFETTSKPFVGKNINILTANIPSGNGLYSFIPEFIIERESDEFWGDYRFCVHTYGAEIKLYSKKDINTSYVRYVHSTFVEAAAAVTNCNAKKLKNLDGALFLFFTQDNNKITWYCTIFGAFRKLMVFDKKLAMFLKPINLSDYNGPEKSSLDLVMATIIKSGG